MLALCGKRFWEPSKVAAVAAGGILGTATSVGFEYTKGVNFSGNETGLIFANIEDKGSLDPTKLKEACLAEKV